MCPFFSQSMTWMNQGCWEQPENQQTQWPSRTGVWHLWPRGSWRGGGGGGGNGLWTSGIIISFGFTQQPCQQQLKLGFETAGSCWPVRPGPYSTWFDQLKLCFETAGSWDFKLVIAGFYWILLSNWNSLWCATMRPFSVCCVILLKKY